MKSFKKLSGKLKLLIFLPALLLPVVLALAMLDRSHSLSMILAAVYLIFTIWWVLHWQKRLVEEVAEYAASMDGLQKHKLENMTMAYALMDTGGEFIWTNKLFRDTFSAFDEPRHLNIICSELAEALPKEGESLSRRVRIGGHIYQAELAYVEAETPGITMSLQDVTELETALQKIEDSKPVIGRVLIDNYDEVMGSTEPVRKALLAALIERKIGKYFEPYDGIISRLDEDKFALTLKKSQLEKIRENRFSVLDDVRSVNVGNTIAPTISIGIGVDGETLAENERYAGAAMDLCLGRGGDQAVVRTPAGPVFYGGKTQQQEKGTRVKARIKAQALKELFEGKDQVLVMGHQMTDIDSLGAAVGIYRIAKFMGKKAHIILDEENSSIRPILDCFRADSSYPADFLIEGGRAELLADEDTVAVVVDVNKPSYTECPALLEKARCIVVLDHHRQGTEVIQNATLSYVEPYASSASEMVAEILQYISDDIKLPVIEAEALYAGIVIDTDNFLSKTGVRTFEAAAYLRRQGADMARVRKLFRGRMEEFKAKAETVRSAEIYEGAFAMAECPAEGLESPTIIGAQAANDLLDIIGVKASLIFTKYEDKVYISARSIDEVNVQLIMERLGGGGHLSIAGAQLKGCTVEEARELAKATISQMIEEGAIEV